MGGGGGIGVVMDFVSSSGAVLVVGFGDGKEFVIFNMREGRIRKHNTKREGQWMELIFVSKDRLRWKIPVL